MEGGVAGDPKMEQAKVEPRAPSCGQQEEGSQATGGRSLEIPVASAAGATSFIIFPGCVPRDLVFGGHKQGGPLQAGVAWRIGTWIGLFI